MPNTEEGKQTTEQLRNTSKTVGRRQKKTTFLKRIKEQEQDDRDGMNGEAHEKHARKGKQKESKRLCLFFCLFESCECEQSRCFLPQPLSGFRQ